MKATFKSYMLGYNGRMDGIVYYYHPIKQICIARKYVKPRESSSNLRFKAIMANLMRLAPSESYILDLKSYIYNYNNTQKSKHDLLIAWNNLFMKLMFAMQKAIPEIDISTLTLEQIFEQDLPCQSVKRAVEAGLIPYINDYEMYNKPISDSNPDETKD